MEHHSIVDQTAPPLQPTAVAPSASAGYTVQASVSAALAVARAEQRALVSSASPLPGTPGDGGRSLADLAECDLDAALQLLAERAQYITGASGAAIALRRSGRNDMLCRASSGSNAPGLGTLLSAETGLSGESVRARIALRCDDSEHDERVNRDGCRELGIASVIIMPIEAEDHVLGVFELFSEKPNAFGERDFSALQRLAGMVETALKITRGPEAAVMDESSAEAVPAELERAAEELATEDLTEEAFAGEAAAIESAPVVDQEEELASEAQSSPEDILLPVDEPVETPSDASAARDVPAPAAPKRPLFWSVAASASAPAEAAADPGGARGDVPRNLPSNVPAVLRNLHKCQACNFPVSEGRKLCVECEEKQWRGQLRYPRPATPEPEKLAASAPFKPVSAGPATPTRGPASPAEQRAAAAAAPAKAVVQSTYPELPATAVLAQAAAPAAKPAASAVVQDPVESADVSGALEALRQLKSASSPGSRSSIAIPQSGSLTAQPSASSTENEDEVRTASEPERSMGETSEAAAPAFLSRMAADESWFSRNKYVLGALLVVAGAVAGILLLR